MHQLESTKLQHLSVHFVGNKVTNESLLLTEEEVEVSEPLENTLKDFFFKPFKPSEYFHFTHPSNVELNEVYSYVSQIFKDYNTFHENSKNLASHLYRAANHANIKGGEFYVAYFSNVAIEGETVNAIGLFKTEHKELFLKIQPQAEHFELEAIEGININKLDKACIIFNREKEEGYVVRVVDKTNASSEALYWVDHFLQVEQREDNYFHTQNTLAAYRSFVVEQLPEEFEINKVDQAELLNRSMDYFKENEDFNHEQFKENVLVSDDLIDSFNDYQRYYEKDYKVDLVSEFAINDQAVKKQQKFFKSVIKLDKNFHIYVHGDRQKIERGTDTNGKYYKLYFDEENF